MVSFVKQSSRKERKLIPGDVAETVEKDKHTLTAQRKLIALEIAETVNTHQDIK